MSSSYSAEMALIPQISDGVAQYLQHLTTVDQLLINMKFESCHTFRYTIMNKEGEKIYEGIEDQDCCSCSGAHGDITILDNYESEVMHLHRGLICTKICFPCCYEALQSIEIYSPPGNLIAQVEEVWTWRRASQFKFNIKNENEDVVLQLETSIVHRGCCEEISELKVLSDDELVAVGKISKQNDGMVRKLSSEISFLFDLPVHTKATLLGACVLIDYMIFNRR